MVKVRIFALGTSKTPRKAAKSVVRAVSLPKLPGLRRLGSRAGRPRVDFQPIPPQNMV